MSEETKQLKRIADAIEEANFYNRLNKMYGRYPMAFMIEDVLFQIDKVFNEPDENQL